jgi:hypothetical protein
VLLVAVIYRFLIAEYRAWDEARTAQSGRRYVRKYVNLGAAGHAATSGGNELVEAIVGAAGR